MTISMYAITVPVLTRYLNNLDAILAKAEANVTERKIKPEVLPASRLAPDMLPLSFQVQSTTDRVKFLMARLTGQTPPSWEDNETTIEQLRGRVQKALAYLATFSEADLAGKEDGMVTLRDKQVPALDHALNNAIPQIFFHLTAAYAILRHNGVPVGKETSSGPESLARALFIGMQSPLAAGALAGWLASGNEVAAFWSAAPGISADRFGAPRLGPARLIARHGIRNVTVPWLSKWPDVVDEAAATGADVLITCATPMIVPDRLLAHFGARAVNIHPAMLPEYRGPSPYLPMLLDGGGDSDGGVTLHVLSPGIDEGDIIAQRRVPFSQSGGRFTSWYAALIHASFDLMRDDLPRYLQGQIVARPQTGGSYHKVRAPAIIPQSANADDVLQMLERAGSTMQLAVELPGRQRPVRVVAAKRRRPRTGAPPVLGPLSVTLDVADARLTLRRATGLERRLERWRLARLLRPLQL